MLVFRFVNDENNLQHESKVVDYSISNLLRFYNVFV